ncbi:hypothetical protein QVD17_11963 [Tagetes erecta]|uniref:Uncharacterized protein n=1 Tax=Tagetes erecta TaxID=13708 RepID=A0AAD8L1P9_TARER|nr:hypothetical protein QVD17_11963 [Tagetes erecta]
MFNHENPSIVVIENPQQVFLLDQQIEIESDFEDEPSASTTSAVYTASPLHVYLGSLLCMSVNKAAKKRRKRVIERKGKVYACRRSREDEVVALEP